MLIEAIVPLKVRLRSGTVDLQPGQPVQFSNEDGRKLLERAPSKVRIIPDIQVGDPIEWQRANGSTHTGVVDFLHVDGVGVIWPFVILEDSWAVVNMKFVTRFGDAQ